MTAAVLTRDGRDLEVPNIGTFPETGIPGRPNFSGELDHTDFRQENGEIGIGFRGAFGDVSLRYEQWNNEHNFLLPPPRNLPNGIGIGQNLENETVQAKGNFELSPVWSVSTQFTFVENLRESNPGPGGTTRAMGSVRQFLPEDIVLDLERDSYTGRAEFRHAAIGPGFTGRFGVEFVQEDQVSRGPVALSPGGEIENISVFAFENIHFGRLHVELGARYDDREQIADPDETFDQSVIPEDPALRQGSWGVFTGSIGANFHVNDNLAIVGNLGRGFRAPELFELFANGVHGGVAAEQRGDPNLDEETSLNLDFGVRWRSERLEFQVNVYRNAIDNYIFLADTGETNPGGLPIFQVDQDDAVLIGADVTLDARLTEQLSIRATGEVVDGEFDDPVGGEEDLPLMPADQAQLEARYDAGRIGPLDGLYLLAGLRYAADKDAAGTREPFSQFDNTPFGTASTESYTLFDLGMGFEVEYSPGQSIEVDIGIENLTDEDYRDFLDTYKGYALSPGRNVWVKTSIPFSFQ
jgi:iron complex outermembrane receptor protein/hemoglobin/transferrin/lactoferrin receptor protein